MGLLDFADAGGALLDLLDREKAAILAGRFDSLDRMAVEKDRLVKAVTRTRLEPLVLANLRERTERNGRLLEAMRAGVAAAQARVRKMQSGPEPLQTYDSTGQIRSITSASGGMTHRA